MEPESCKDANLCVVRLEDWHRINSPGAVFLVLKITGVLCLERSALSFFGAIRREMWGMNMNEPPIIEIH